MERSIDLPAYVTDATVFLNGWRLEFLHDDHDIADFGAAITRISKEGQTLRWRATGVLSDENFDDGYRFCHYFTALAWNQGNLRLLVDHDDGTCRFDSADPESNWFTATHDTLQVDNFPKHIDGSLSSFATFLENPRLTSNKTVAVLPRGFAFGWRDCDDHELHQAAYNLNGGEKFIERGKRYRKGALETVPNLPSSASQAEFSHVSWITDSILKDDRRKRNYQFGEIVSGLGGNNIGVIRPPYAILPIESGGDNVGFVDVISKEFRIERVPFQHAIPMLTGWDLRYEGAANEIRRIGIWIGEIHYEMDPTGPFGTLRYTLLSELNDTNLRPPFLWSHNVHVLGLRPTP